MSLRLYKFNYIAFCHIKRQLILLYTITLTTIWRFIYTYMYIHIYIYTYILTVLFYKIRCIVKLKIAVTLKMSRRRHTTSRCLNANIIYIIDIVQKLLFKTDIYMQVNACIFNI